MSAESPDNALSFHEFEQAGWSDPQLVDNYDSGFRSLTTQVVPFLLDAVKVTSGVRALDIATGPGYAAAAAAERGADVVAIDFSAAMIAAAARRYPAVDFRQGDAQRLDFPSAGFDAVMINFGLMHFEQPEVCLLEANRVLRSGGWVGFTVWADPQKTVAVGLLQNALQTHGNPNVPLPSGTPFFRFSNHEECRRILERSGFTKCQVVEVGQTWEFGSADDLLRALEEGTVRNRALLLASGPEQIDSIRRAFRGSLSPYLGSDGALRVPMPAVLASAMKP